jgi:predicted flap endonuclease-1-like 5' DNA nuclease
VQIAAWTSQDEEKIGDKLAFPGRIEREEWVKQAKQLLADGDA